MNVRNLTAFLKWCTILNGGLLIIFALFAWLAPDFVYTVQSAFVPVTRGAFDVVLYSFLGAFKVVWIMFNLVPYVAVSIVGKNARADMM